MKKVGVKMRKKLKLLCFFATVLMFNIVNVSAKEITNIDDLKECLLVGGTCTLIGNIENSSDSIEINSSTDVTLDLNGYSMVNYNFVINAGKFTLDDSIGGGIVDTLAKKGFEVKNSSFIINNGKIIAAETAIRSENSQVTINAGEFIGKGFEENQYGTKGMSIYGGNTIINGGKFNALQDGNYSAAGLFVSPNAVTATNVTINGGHFYGADDGLHVEGGILEINDGTFEGDLYGIWLTNGYISENYVTIINNGEFKGGYTGIRIMGRNKSIITGGIYIGTQMGLYIQCANPISETCKDAILLKGGDYKSLSNGLGGTYPATAIFMDSDPDAPVKISDLLDDGYELSDNNILEKDGGQYGYYSYTESLNVSISNPNLNNFDNGSDEIISIPDDQKDEEIIENPKTGAFISITSLTGVAALSSYAIIRLKKKNKF